MIICLLGHCLSRNKLLKFTFQLAIQIYAIALYVEAAKAARELGIRDRGGFFKDASDEDYATAIVDGAFDKLLQVHLVRNVEGTQFYEVSCDRKTAYPPVGRPYTWTWYASRSWHASCCSEETYVTRAHTDKVQALEKHLAPRLRLTGGMDSLQKFGDFINSQSLQKDTDVLMLWRDGDNLDVGVKPPGSAELSEASYPPTPATAQWLLASAIRPLPSAKSAYVHMCR